MTDHGTPHTACHCGNYERGRTEGGLERGPKPARAGRQPRHDGGQAETATEAARAARGLYVASTEHGYPLAETSTARAARTGLRPVAVATEAR
jgi:hypothetical protein